MWDRDSPGPRSTWRRWAVPECGLPTAGCRHSCGTNGGWTPATGCDTVHHDLSMAGRPYCRLARGRVPFHAAGQRGRAVAAGRAVTRGDRGHVLLAAPVGHHRTADRRVRELCVAGTVRVASTKDRP